MDEFEKLKQKAKKFDKFLSDSQFEMLLDWLDEGYDIGLSEGETIGYKNAMAEDRPEIDEEAVEEAFEEGRSEGHSEGYEEGYEKGHQDAIEDESLHNHVYDTGYEEGKTIGHEEGYEEGYEIGKNEGFAEGVEYN